MWLILIDAYSKWPEIYAMSVTTAQAMIQQLHKIFTEHGLPELLITDNGPQFVTSKCCQAIYIDSSVSSMFKW